MGKADKTNKNTQVNVKTASMKKRLPMMERLYKGKKEQVHG